MNKFIFHLGSSIWQQKNRNLCLFLLLFFGVLATSHVNAQPRIYEIYSAGGVTGATWGADYIVLSGFTANQSLTGYYIQYRGGAAAPSDFWQIFTLTGNADANGFFRIKCAGSGAAPWTPAQTIALQMSNTGNVSALKGPQLVLTTVSTAFANGTCPLPANYADLVGYIGINAATSALYPPYCYEGTGGATETANSGTQSRRRKTNVNPIGIDTQDNGADFEIINNPYTSTCTNPIAYTVTGGGAYCAGGAGLAVGLANSESGVTYQLQKDNVNEGSPVSGTGAAISFGTKIAAGTYTVIATRTTGGCTANMTGSVAITVTPTVTPSVSIAANPGNTITTGTSVTFTATPVNGGTTPVYQWTKNNVNVGTNSPTYTDAALANTDEIRVDMQGNANCATTSSYVSSNVITMTVNSGGTNCNLLQADRSGYGGYQESMQGQTFVPTCSGQLTSISYTLESFTGARTLTIKVKASANPVCSGTELYSATLNFNGGGAGSPFPFIVHTLTSPISVTAGTTYFLEFTGTAAKELRISSTDAYAGGVYYTTNATDGVCAPFSIVDIAFELNIVGGASCTNPTAYTVTGGGAYCAGGTGLAVGLANSESGVTYQLQKDNVNDGSPVSGTGAAISFGTKIAAGTYTVIATRTTGGCTANMTGSVAISINPLPIVSSSATTVCSGSTLNLTPTSGGTWASSSISTATVTNAGLVSAVLTGANTGTVSFTFTSGAGCSQTTNAITVYPLPNGTITNPNPTAVCQNDAAPVMNFSGTATHNAGRPFTFAYSINGTPQAPLSTTGNAATVAPPISTANAGTLQYVLTSVSNNYGCVRTISSPANNQDRSITINPTPLAYSVTGGGGYCAGGTGVAVGLANSETGVTYQLQKDNVNEGSPENGTGAAISFGTKTAAGTYTVIATKGTCTATMTGSATITVNPTPLAYAVTGGGAYCAGSAGVAVGLNNSESGVSYQLQKDNVDEGSPENGTGAAISFGAKTAAGTYTVIATRGTCSATMTGSASIIVNPAPTVYNVTGGGAYCAGGTGVAVGLANSEMGISYQLFYNNATDGAAINGTNAAISFGTKTAAGNYTVVATNNTTSCTADMSGTATITINPVPPANALPIVTASNNNPCAGTTVTLTATAPAGFTAQEYLWSKNGTAVNYVNGGNGQYTVAAGTIAVSNTYTLKMVYAGYLCFSNSSIDNVVITRAPQAIITATGPTSFCANTPTILSANTGMSSYQWKRGTTIVQMGGTNYTPTASGNHTVTVTDGYGCTKISTATNITVKLLPVANAGVDVPVCFGESVSIGANPVSGNTYTWSPTTGLSNAYIAKPLASPATTTTYTVTVNNATTGCTNTDAVIVSTKIGPTTPSITKTVSGTTITLNCTSPAATSIDWYRDGVLFSANKPANSSITVAASNPPKVYNVKSKGANGCSSSFSNFVTARNGDDKDGDLVIELDNNIMNAYPNPTNSNLQVEIQNTEVTSGTLYLYDAIGQRVLSQNVELVNGAAKLSLDLTNMASGIYSLSFQKQVIKVVKE